MQAMCSIERLLEYTAWVESPITTLENHRQEERRIAMTKHVITIVREDGEIDYLYEETVKYNPPPYEVKAVDREIYCYHKSP
jgi:uncharacterized tellurite resistance protein B-like protein